MSEEKDLKQAQSVYKSICEMLNERDWHYEGNDEDLTIESGAQGEDLPMDIIIKVDAKRKLVSLMSPMPFIIPEKRRTALAIAVSLANNGMVDGSFDYNYISGKLLYRVTTSYRESLISKNVFAYMLMCTCYTVDEYNDKFLTVAKNEMSEEEILDYIK